MTNLINTLGIIFWIITNISFVYFSIQVLKNNTNTHWGINLQKNRIMLLFCFELALFLLMKISYSITPQSNDFGFYYNNLYVYPKGILSVITIFEKSIKLNDHSFYSSFLIVLFACMFDYIYLLLLSIIKKRLP